MQNTKLKETIFFNGKFILGDEIRISVFTFGFQCGFGLFETMRAYNNKIVYLDEHLKRIEASCQLLGLEFPYSPGKLKDIIKKAVRICGERDIYVKLSLFKSEQKTDILITAKKYNPYSSQKYKRGFFTQTSRFRQDENSLPTRIKTISRILYELSFQEAKAKGFDEAIILNHRGYITEASRSNLFFVKDKEIFTPSLECGCLAGITRKAVFDLAKKYRYRIYTGNFTLQDLSGADEAFLTNSLMGLMPLVCVEKRLISNGIPGRLTQFFIKRYNLLLKNGI